MKIILAKAENQKIWNDFVAASSYGSFLQSWEWGEFQESLGHQIFRLMILDKNQILGVVLLIKQPLFFGRFYLYAPFGPVLNIRNLKFQIGQMLMATIKKIAKKEKAVFLRFEPKDSSDEKMPQDFIQTLDIQPSRTQILDLKKSPEELLAQMHPKTRYNIQLSSRRGVKVRESQDSKEAKIFYKLAQETGERNQFKIYPFDYYQKMVKILGQADLLKIFSAEYDQKTIAAILVIYFGKTAVYTHGASSSDDRNLMAPHLLQWKAILESMKRNCESYDFWGVAPPGDEQHPWAGISRFKRGFSGNDIKYMGCYDLPYRKIFYKTYQSLRKVRRTAQ
jgi:lipid II:glycine glycyltransferase (peptidoglycan interpeptide bridge formation enzyme)